MKTSEAPARVPKDSRVKQKETEASTTKLLRELEQLGPDANFQQIQSLVKTYHFKLTFQDLGDKIAEGWWRYKLSLKHPDREKSGDGVEQSMSYRESKEQTLKEAYFFVRWCLNPRKEKPSLADRLKHVLYNIGHK